MLDVRSSQQNASEVYLREDRALKPYIFAAILRLILCITYIIYLRSNIKTVFQ